MHCILRQCPLAGQHPTPLLFCEQTRPPDTDTVSRSQCWKVRGEWESVSEWVSLGRMSVPLLCSRNTENSHILLTTDPNLHSNYYQGLIDPKEEALATTQYVYMYMYQLHVNVRTVDYHYWKSLSYLRGVQMDKHTHALHVLCRRYSWLNQPYCLCRSWSTGNYEYW